MPEEAASVFHTRALPAQHGAARSDCCKVGAAIASPVRSDSSFLLVLAHITYQNQIFRVIHGKMRPKMELKRTEDEYSSINYLFCGSGFLPPRRVALNLGTTTARPFQNIEAQSRYRIFIRSVSCETTTSCELHFRPLPAGVEEGRLE